MNIIQKLAIGATTAAILLGSVVTPTFASSRHHGSKPTNVTIVSNENKFTKVKTFNIVEANTGGNVQVGHKSDDNKIITGDANAVGVNKVNVNTNTTIINN